MYKKAAQMKLRVATNRGNLSVEQLYDLSKEEIGQLAIAYRPKKPIDDEELSFLKQETSAEETPEQLTFRILKDIYLTKQAEEDKAHRRAEVRQRNRKLLEVIARKQDEALESKSIEELEAMLEEEGE